MDYRLSDFTLAGWGLIVTQPLVTFALWFPWGSLLVKLLGQGDNGIPYIVLALPGLLYMGLYWLLCRRFGIRLVKESRSH